MAEPDERALGRRAYGGRRVSTQRLAIARAADAATRAFTVDDLAAAVRRDLPGVGPATVYRAIAAMQASGFVEAVGSRDGAALFARCRATGHHHHIVCTQCGRVEDTECCVEGSLERASAASGFRVTRHELSLFGVCGECSAAPEEAS